MDLYQIRSTCRVCGAPFDPLLDLGEPVLSGFPLPSEPDPPRVPLDLVICQSCDLVQLRHTTNPDLLYRDYWYQSGINEVMVAELTDIQRAAVGCLGGLPKHAVVLDVGANDGTLLRQYDDFHRPVRIAVEPAQTFRDRLVPHADLVISDYFPSAETRALKDGSIDVLTSIAMLYDLDDPLAFVAEVDRLLSPAGVWIVQMQDLGQMVRATAYDNIVHEHLCYYSTKTFSRLLYQTGQPIREDVGLRICRVERRAINGGSLRFYIRRPPYQPRTTIPAPDESWLTRAALDRFAWRVGEHRAQLCGLLDHLRRQSHPVDLYAASTKSSTLLQHCGLDHTWIRCAVERSQEKVGRVTSGTRIPIVWEPDWRIDPAPATLLGAWQYKSAFVQREAEYLARGGSFVVPLPAVEVVCGSRI